MQKKFIMALVPSSSANAALDNLAEADYDQVSVVMQDVSQARQLADDVGPLKGVDGAHVQKALEKYVSLDTASAAQGTINKGAVLIVLRTDAGSVDSAKEILKGAGAQQVESS